jgi:hypothetical protein
MGTILERGIRARQPVFLDLIRPEEDPPRGKEARIVGADFEAGTVTVEVTVPAEWVRENPNV